MTEAGGNHELGDQLSLSAVRYAVRTMITDVIFVYYKQFVSSDGNEDFGSKWQKAVCRDVNMGEEELRRFWEAQKGKQIARRILNCRRNNPAKNVELGYWSIRQKKLHYMVCWLHVLNNAKILE